MKLNNINDANTASELMDFIWERSRVEDNDRED